MVEKRKRLVYTNYEKGNKLMDSTKVKRRDIILVLVIFIIAGIIFAINLSLAKGKAEVVIVKVNQEIDSIYSLREFREVEIDDTNVIEITNGKVKMINANCPDKLCMQQHEISRRGESIICLPNRVVITIDGKANKEADIVIGMRQIYEE